MRRKGSRDEEMSFYLDPVTYCMLVVHFYLFQEVNVGVDTALSTSSYVLECTSFVVAHKRLVYEI